MSVRVVVLALAIGLASTRTYAQGADEPSSESTPTPTPMRPVFLDASVSASLVSRHLRYTDDLYGFLRPYDLSAGASFGFALRAFPAAFSGHPVAASLGLEVRFEQSVGIRSERAGVRFPTTNQLVEVNLLERWMIGRHELVGVVGYGNHAFVLGRDTPSSPAVNAVPDVPNVRYSYLRIGLETRLVVHRFVAFRVAAAYLEVFDTGGISDRLWFPRSRASGVTLAAKVVVPIRHGLEGRVGFEYRRYFFDLRPEVGDPIIAGGALDQTVVTSAELAYRY